MVPSEPPCVPATAECVCDVFRRTTGTSGSVLRAERYPIGFGHENWLVSDAGGTRWLVKIADRRRSPLRMENAVAAQRLAAAGGVRVPEILGFGRGPEPFGRPYCVQTWIAGDDAAVALPTMTPARKRTFAAALADQVARLHSVASDWVGEGVLPELRCEGWPQFAHAQAERVRDLAVRTASLDRPTLDAAVGACHALADAIDPGFTPGLVHRDLWPPNVVVSPEGGVNAILDFEHARFADPAWDLVKLDLVFLRAEPAVADAFREAYAAARGWTAAFDLRIRLCFGLELLRGMSYFHAEFPDAAMAAMLDDELRRWLRER